MQESSVLNVIHDLCQEGFSVDSLGHFHEKDFPEVIEALPSLKGMPKNDSILLRNKLLDIIKGADQVQDHECIGKVGNFVPVKKEGKVEDSSGLESYNDHKEGKVKDMLKHMKRAYTVEFKDGNGGKYPQWQEIKGTTKVCGMCMLVTC